LLPIYELPSDVSFAEPRFWVSAVAFLGVCALAFALRRRAPAILAAWIAFVVAIFPVIGFTQTGPQLVADRYSYLACMPFALLAAGAWLAVRDSMRTLASSMAVACVGVLGVLTFRQTSTWHDTATMFERVIALKPASPTGYAQMATYRSYQASRAQNSEEQQRLLLEANGYYRRALDADSNPFATLVLNYGSNLLAIGKPREAVEQLERYVAARPEDPRGLTNLGIALGMLGLLPDAVAALERAVATDPNYAIGWRQLAAMRERTGDKHGAIVAYERVLQLTPNDASARERIEALKSQP
jgi:tetratricopeptide (TPR) repeat protein